MKAIIIYFDGIGFNIRTIKGVKALFSNHKPRHYISSILGMIIPHIKFIMEILHQIIELLHTPSSKNNLDDLAVSIVDNDEEKAMRIISNRIDNVGKGFMEIFDFWEKADNYKMRGFYVDYVDKLVSPKDITESEYKIAFNATTTFKTQCLNLISYSKNLSNDERKHLVMEFNNNMKFKDMLQQLIDNSKNVKKANK